VAEFLDAMQRQHADRVREVHGAWREDTLDFSFVASGLSIRGSLIVEETHVAVSGSLPLAAALFRGQIERTIREELSRLLT
jgi:hypothetical protein